MNKEVYNSPITFGDTSEMEYTGKCYVMPVGDNPTGILEHAMKEGTIFQGAADPGASVRFLERYGINIDSLRSGQRRPAQITSLEEYNNLINNGAQLK